MLKRKKKDISLANDKPVKVEKMDNPTVDEIRIEESDADKTDVKSIEEFMELKKLQNIVLKKMLEKINQIENQVKLNNK